MPFTSTPDFDRHLEAQMDAMDAEADAYAEWAEENDLDPEADNTEAWDSYKDSWYDDLMEDTFEQEQADRMEMGDSWYE